VSHRYGHDDIYLGYLERTERRRRSDLGNLTEEELAAINIGLQGLVAGALETSTKVWGKRKGRPRTFYNCVLAPYGLSREGYMGQVSKEQKEAGTDYGGGPADIVRKAIDDCVSIIVGHYGCFVRVISVDVAPFPLQSRDRPVFALVSVVAEECPRASASPASDSPAFFGKMTENERHAVEKTTDPPPPGLDDREYLVKFEPRELAGG
jgi:hypothetical protein